METENQQTKKIREESQKSDGEKTCIPSLYNYIKGVGDRNLKYINSNILIQELKTTAPHNPLDIEQIAKALVLSDSNSITTTDVFLYRQIIKALKQIEYRNPDAKVEE